MTIKRVDKSYKKSAMHSSSQNITMQPLNRINNKRQYTVLSILIELINNTINQIGIVCNLSMLVAYQLESVLIPLVSMGFTD